jgi:hypothetical protein
MDSCALKHINYVRRGAARWAEVAVAEGRGLTGGGGAWRRRRMGAAAQAQRTQQCMGTANVNFIAGVLYNWPSCPTPTGQGSA